MSAWDSKHPRKPSKVLQISHRLSSMSRDVHRQEMSIHQRRLHPWSNLVGLGPTCKAPGCFSVIFRQSEVNKDASDHHCPSRLFALHQEIPKVKNSPEQDIMVLDLRYEKRHRNIPAHLSPCFRCKEGDMVIIGECRPLSKTVRFNVLRVVSKGSGGGGKKFSKF